MKSHLITLTLKDSSKGYEISPDRVPISVLTDFSKDVSDFIRGSARGGTDSIDVSIQKGSLALVASDVTSPAVFHDLKTLENSGDLSKIDPKRKEIVEKWQEQAGKNKSFRVNIATEALGRGLEFSSTSNYKDLSATRLVPVERYIRGEILDLGGVSSPNAYVQMLDGKKLKIKVSKELIQSESRNRVYQEAHMRIRGMLNIDTNELMNVELISFIEYAPAFSKENMERLIANGRKAWADVEDPVDWINSMRGGH